MERTRAVHDYIRTIHRPETRLAPSGRTLLPRSEPDCRGDRPGEASYTPDLVCPPLFNDESREIMRLFPEHALSSSTLRDVERGVAGSRHAWGRLRGVFADRL